MYVHLEVISGRPIDNEINLLKNTKMKKVNPYFTLIHEIFKSHI